MLQKWEFLCGAGGVRLLGEDGWLSPEVASGFAVTREVGVSRERGLSEGSFEKAGSFPNIFEAP